MGHLGLGTPFGKIGEYHNPLHSTVLPCSITPGFEDDISELSLPSC